MRVLGISAFQRDSAAALIAEGEVVAAAQEASFSKKRADSGMPKRAIRHCLERAGITGPELDAVVFYEKPLRKFERLLASQLQAFPRSARVFSRSMFVWLGDRLWIKGRLAEEVGVDGDRVHFVEHAASHVAAAFFTSPFDEAALLCLDDAGEWATTLFARGAGDSIEHLGEIHFPHSLGLFASAVTQFLGFEAGADEETVESLAAWGEPKFVEALGRLLPASDDGAFSVDTKPFRFDFDGDVLFGDGLHDLLGSHRKPGGALRFREGDRRDADVAASLQVVLEERALGLCRKLHERTGLENLCLAGSLASNRRLVERLRVDGPFRALHVPAASGKAGAALGAAYLGHALLAPDTRCARSAALGLGPRLDGAPEEGAEALGAGACAEAARRLEAGQVLGWVDGALEFADTALGARLILAAAAAPEARERLLGAVQRPEAYLRCRVLLDAARAHAEFDLPADAESLLRDGRLAIHACEALRNAAPSAIAPDGTVVVQLVDSTRQPALHALLEAVRARSGAAVLLAEAFHLRGMPVVRTELDAVEAFGRSTLDALFVEDRLYASA